MNWSYLAHSVGDMSDDDEFQEVLVRLPDGRLVKAESLEKIDGRWVLTVGQGEQ